jgi:uncharacterized protein
MRIRTAIISAILAIAIIAIALFFFMRNGTQPTEVRQEPPSRTLQALEFEVVASPEARAQGLSGRSEVPPGYGMLFVFDAPERYGFWMKDMLVSIDIIWLDNDGTIIGIEENVSPATYPKPFYPPRAVRLVLETKAGEARAQGWGVGTKLSLPL